MATLDVIVRFTSALRMGLRITNPESQNTGMETTQPMSSTASSGRFFPTTRMTISASFNAAPVASRIVPMSAPRMMTMPMLVNVPEKPEPMTLASPGVTVPSAAVLFTSGTPATSPSTSEMPMMERNGWIFHFEMARIIRTMAATNARISGKPDMMKPPFESALRTRCCRVPPVDTVYRAARCFMMFCARLSSRISSEISVPHANTAQGRATDLV